MSPRISPLALLSLASAASIALATAACSSSSSSGASPGDGGTTTDGSVADTGSDTAPPQDSATSDGGVDAATPSGSGTIAGTVGGTSFGQVYSAFLIGAPDVATDTALYLVGAQGVACSDIGKSGWSHTIAGGVQIFEMILTTSTPAGGTYTVSTATAPPAGSAEVNYILSAPTRNETRATGGTITLTALTPGASAVGTFSVQFPSNVGDGGADAGANALDGTFAAAFCAAAHEP